MTLIILGEAERDFTESIAYYESKEPGLGWRFRNEVAEAAGQGIGESSATADSSKGELNSESLRERVVKALKRKHSFNSVHETRNLPYGARECILPAWWRW